MDPCSTRQARPWLRLSRVGAALIALLLVAAMTAAAEMRCVGCGRRVEGRYLKSGDQAFCSESCYRQSLPVCAVCGQPCTGTFLRDGNRTFCSKNCFEAQLPKCEICGTPLRTALSMDGHFYCERHAHGPRCSHCQLPFRSARKLEDGRLLCTACYPQAIMNPAPARKLYRRAQQEVFRITRRMSPTLPELELVGLDQMPAGRQGSPEKQLVQQGLYRRTTTKTTTKNIFGWTLKTNTETDEHILLLYGLAEDEFLSTAAHELMHDILAEAFPHFAGIAPTWAEEGVCQYVAALVCRRNGFTEQLARIETSPHPEYGDGYRYLCRRFGDNNWPALAVWLATVDSKSIAATAP